MNWDEAHLLGDLEAQEERRMTDDLVERLRWAADNSNGCGEWNCAPGDLDEAADRIEELEAKLAKAVEECACIAESHKPSAAFLSDRYWRGVDEAAHSIAYEIYATLAELTGEQKNGNV